MKPFAGALLGGARSRLLPATIPFRFFGAAVVALLIATGTGLLLVASSTVTHRWRARLRSSCTSRSPPSASWS